MPKVSTVTLSSVLDAREVTLPNFDKQYLDDVSFVTAMTLVLMGNYCQTGHFGGPLAYTPYCVASHLIGPELGGLKYDYRRPKHPFSDKFMLAGGHNAPVTYALWMVLGEALYKKHQATGDSKYLADYDQTLLPIDCIGFRRSKKGMETILAENGLTEHPSMTQAKLRGIRALSGHSESTDVTNDVNGGPSGIGIATAAGKATFWDIIGAAESPKVMAVEGEFAMTSGHSQEMKTQAVAQQVGKRLRVLMSYNNAGIDDELVGGVIQPQYESYRIVDQWTSYGWNVFTVEDANDMEQVVAAFKAMEDTDPSDRRPMILVGKTTKGWWPGAENGQIPGYGNQIISYQSHPYTFAMNSDYFSALASTFENRYGVKFKGIEDGPISDEKERLIQYKENIDIAMSVLDQNGLGDWIAERLVEIGEQVEDDLTTRIDTTKDPFLDERLDYRTLSIDPKTVTATNPISGEQKEVEIKMFEDPGVAKGSRRAISEIVKWVNYVTDNRLVLAAADLADSINVEKGSLWGEFDPVTNPAGIRLRSAIQEAGNVSTAVGLVSQSASLDPEKHSGVWALSGTYGAFTPLMYLPVRVWSQQNQDSPFRLGVLNILAGHSGPETAADARTHFGIFSPQVWKLFPRDQVINLNFWDYNDVAPGYLAAAEIAARDPKVGVIVLEVARPDFPVIDRSRLADSDIKAAAKGFYILKDFDPSKPKEGYIVVQGSSCTSNLVAQMDDIEEAGHNVRIIAAVSEELFNRQPKQYRDQVLPESAKYNMMIVSTGTKRMWPVSGVGPLTEEYSLVSDHDDVWLSGGSEGEVLKEARLDPSSIFEAVAKFSTEHSQRMKRQSELLLE
ncbi:MAG: transketolase-like TK C-terminal-containing protein [Dehalococcoidia bacterium]